MSLRSRIARLEKTLGEIAAPKLVVISTARDRHEVQSLTPNYLSLSVPWNEGSDPRDALTDEQRALIEPHDRVVAICLPPNGRE